MQSNCLPLLLTTSFSVCCISYPHLLAALPLRFPNLRFESIRLLVCETEFVLFIFLLFLQVQNAATHGAKTALLYTDPAQYAQAGVDPNDTYPNTEWIPNDGVRLGTVLSVFGDPLTHGLPAIPGMYRKAINDSGLPPIPAYPMSYGDAVYFLSRIGG